MSPQETPIAMRLRRQRWGFRRDMAAPGCVADSDNTGIGAPRQAACVPLPPTSCAESAGRSLWPGTGSTMHPSLGVAAPLVAGDKRAHPFSARLGHALGQVITGEAPVAEGHLGQVEAHVGGPGIGELCGTLHKGRPCCNRWPRRSPALDCVANTVARVARGQRQAATGLGQRVSLGPMVQDIEQASILTATGRLQHRRRHP